MSPPFRIADTEIADLVDRIAGTRGARVIVAIAGAPGSGKSTLAERLAGGLDARMPGSAAVLPMDGYHFDDAILLARGMRARKGAPDTFDVAGLDAMLDRLAANRENEIFVPVFDRSVELSRAAASAIPQSARFVLVEGNYLLCATTPWGRLRARFDLTLLLDVPRPVLQARLEARWHGFGLSPDGVAKKVWDNDLPNGRFVIENSIEPDIVVHHSAKQ